MVKITLKNIITVLIMFMGSSIYFFFKSANNTKGLIIDRIFKLNVGEANNFYFVMGCIGILLLTLYLTVAYLQNKPTKK